MHSTYEVTGYIVGDIWMPCVESYKPLKLRFEREDNKRSNPFIDCFETLRDAILNATNDGDFRSCKIADGTLRVTHALKKGFGQIIYQRDFDLSLFKSVSDMVMTDWCGPQNEED